MAEEIQKSEQIHRNMELEANITDEDTDDKVKEEEEYNSREIERIRREREARKLRNMTMEERREWERNNLKPASQPKQKWSFKQKYYHQGPFFQDDPDDPAAT